MDWRKYRYGISLDEYNDMLSTQNNKCAICKIENDKSNNMVIDHCHKTNKIRGLLCKKCNSGIGFFNDDLVLIENSISYLKKYENSNMPIKREYRKNLILNIETDEIEFGSIKEMAHKFNISRQTIHNHFKKYGHFKKYYKK